MSAATTRSADGLVDRQAQPDQDQAGARPAGVHDPVTDHVRAAVRLRVRRRDRPAGRCRYREFLIAGIFAQTVVFGATITGVGLAEDIQKGIIDRFRSLPMSPSAVLVGPDRQRRLYNVISIVVMALTGLLVGWRIRGSVLEALGPSSCCWCSPTPSPG